MTLRRNRTLHLAGAALLLLSSGCGRKSASPPAGPAAIANWSEHNGDVDQSGYSRLDQVNLGNIGKLGLAWSLDLPDEHYLEATPLAVNGVIYLTGSMCKVYAVDGLSGKILWQFDPETWRYSGARQTLGMPANRGVAYADGRIFLGAYDGRLIALDAKTGKQLWSSPTIIHETNQAITAAPVVLKDKVLIGNGGADYNARGFVTAFDAATGKQLWRFYTVPGDPKKDGDNPAMAIAAKTWGKDFWKKTGGGGTVWDAMTYDPALNRVYIGVGNSGPYDPSIRDPKGGDDLFLASIVALDADTGKYIWHFQENPREAWDYKATTTIISTSLNLDGHPRKVLMQAPSNGFIYVLDRDSGKFISAGKLGKVTWAKGIDPKTGRPIEEPGIRYESGQFVMWPQNGHGWQSMSFSPKTGLVYIPYMNNGARFSKFQPGQHGMRLGGWPLTR